MCSLIGALLRDLNDGSLEEAEIALTHIWRESHARGRDGRGYMNVYRRRGQAVQVEQERSTARLVGAAIDVRPQLKPCATTAFIANLRAEPTTEFVANKRVEDQQPYSQGAWSIVHNGTIANDALLRTHRIQTRIDSAAIVEVLEDEAPGMLGFTRAVRKLKGSFAILAVNKDAPDKLFVACNYRPVWYAETDEGFYFASSRAFFPPTMVPRMLKPYSIAEFRAHSEPLIVPLAPAAESKSKKALVVCSGGLDSVVSAAWAKHKDMDVTLLHFQYGSRAEGPEVRAVAEIAAAMGVPLLYQKVELYREGDSPLLDAKSKIAGGEAGAEFAYEWVPARNLMMLAMATALAEARGIDTIILGNNLEEAGAYPDNEPEFIDRMNDVLPFAVGDGKRMKILMPVGNMMKHEIVKLGHEVGAPMHLTWSCYRAGAKHCGTCGPCFMRRTAFAINELPEVIEYET